MSSPALSKFRRGWRWTRELPYACPRCGQADIVHLSRWGFNENGTWPCPHCQAKLTILETRKGLLILAMLPLPISSLALRGEPRWLQYLALLLVVGLCFGLHSLLSRPQVALMPEPKDWT